MKQFYVFANRSKDGADDVAAYVVDFLGKRGLTVTSKPEEADCALVLGGDGTMLRFAGEYPDIPLLGINLGNVGFLAEVDRDNIDRALEKLASGEFEIEERMMLGGEVLSKKADGAIHSALNDIVIAGITSMRLIYFDLYINGLKLTSYAADGMIISTPTGSTGYNLSAGGPIAIPVAEAILLTPICSHSMQSRSIILSADDEVQVAVSKGKYGETQKVEAIFDGHLRLGLKTGHRIRIRKSQKIAHVIKISSQNFLEILKQKL